jgi:hypothetical protein
VYFLLDHYLASLSKHVTENYKRTVHDNTKAVQKAKNLEESDIEVFSAMGYTRNSFHNNGIYQGKTIDNPITISGRQYHFTNGNQVKLSWLDISTLIHAAIETAQKWGQSISDDTLVPEKH